MAEKKKILVVDDEPFVLSAITDTLNEKYDVCGVNNGEEALSVLSGLVPDLIMLDMMMPGMDGLEVCRKLKENQLVKNVPIIFLTGMGQITDIEKGFTAGAECYIVKPFSAVELIKKVDDIIFRNTLKA
jgi:putative two-component system response regulator